MAYFKDLKSLFSHLHNNVIPDVMNNEVVDTVTQVQSRKVQEEVYDPYTPFEYNRRGWVGGLADPNNNIATFSYSVNEVSMLLQNITKGENGYYIAPLIEHGHGYKGMEYEYTQNRDGTQDQYMRSRPFISETIKYLKATMLHEDAFKRGLKRHGIDAY